MVYETTEYKGHKIEIDTDCDPIDPIKDFDMLGTMVFCHSRYALGHEQTMDMDEYMTNLAIDADPKLEDKIDKLDWNDDMIEEYVNRSLEKNYVILPIYMYDHSGITINTSGYSCPWDSGQVGYIYVSKSDVRKEWKVNRISKKLMSKVIGVLVGEIETYDQYLTGDIYGYNVYDNTGEVIDSCWGFYGTDWENNGLLEYAKNAIDCELEKQKI